MWSLWDDIYFGSYSPVDDDMGAVIFVPESSASPRYISRVKLPAGFSPRLVTIAEIRRG